MLDIANIGEKKDTLGLHMELSNPLNVLFWFWVGLGVLSKWVIFGRKHSL